LRDQVSGLHIIAEELIRKTGANLAIVTLGEAGSLVITKQLEIDRLPSLNTAPVDVSGAGDSMLVGVALAKSLKIDSFSASYIGAIASAIQIGRVGNSPIKISEIKEALM
jgi:bifunctional ADP-heptose synthase (sugar kinase/adenylyltransferase)